MMQISDGYPAIHGVREGATEIARSECLASVHPNDIRSIEQYRNEAFRDCRREYKVEYRIVRPGCGIRWVETRCFISYNGEGHPQRVVGVSIDITERKRVEEQQRTLLAELTIASRMHWPLLARLSLIPSVRAGRSLISQRCLMDASSQWQRRTSC
jgi:PAS domain S-box-containing protein